MLRFSLSLLVACLACLAARADSQQVVLVVVGAPGSDEYDRQFRQWAAGWEKASQQAGARFAQIGQEATSDRADRQLVQEQLESLRADPADTLFIVLIGHGTFDGREAKFNLRGPDVSAREMAEWLAGVWRPHGRGELRVVERRLSTICPRRTA